MVYLEIFIAALAAFLLGFLWYTALFGKVWQTESGISDEEAKKGMGLTHGIAFLMMLVIAYFMGPGGYGQHLKDGDIFHGAFHGFYIAIRFAVPLLIINYMYQKKSLKLILIDAGYAIAFFSVIGAMIAILPLAGAPEVSLEDAQKALEGAQEYLKEKQDLVNSLTGGGN